MFLTLALHSALLYTAPEILRTGLMHLDHVGAGTIQGDMYRYGLLIISSQNYSLDIIIIDVSLCTMRLAVASTCMCSHLMIVASPGSRTIIIYTCIVAMLSCMGFTSMMSVTW